MNIHSQHSMGQYSYDHGINISGLDRETFAVSGKNEFSNWKSQPQEDSFNAKKERKPNIIDKIMDPIMDGLRNLIDSLTDPSGLC